MKHILHILFVVSIVCMLLISCSTDVEPTPRRNIVNRDSTSSGGGGGISIVFDDTELEDSISLD